MTRPSRGALLSATVRPGAARFLVDRYGVQLERDVGGLLERGAPHDVRVAHELQAALAQLGRAAQQIDPMSGRGRSDGPSGPQAPSWDPADDPGLDTRAAAELLQVTPRQITRLAGAHRISGRRVGGRWQLDAESVAAEAARRTEES